MAVIISYLYNKEDQGSPPFDYRTHTNVDISNSDMGSLLLSQRNQTSLPSNYELGWYWQHDSDDV